MPLPNDVEEAAKFIVAAAARLDIELARRYWLDGQAGCGCACGVLAVSERPDVMPRGECGEFLKPVTALVATGLSPAEFRGLSDGFEDVTAGNDNPAYRKYHAIGRRTYELYWQGRRAAETAAP